jgi:hypothetical protein
VGQNATAQIDLFIYIEYKKTLNQNGFTANQNDKDKKTLE